MENTVVLHVVKDYRNQNIFWKAGEVVRDVSRDKAAWFIRDAPECFEIHLEDDPILKELFDELEQQP